MSCRPPTLVLQFESETLRTVPVRWLPRKRKQLPVGEELHQVLHTGSESREAGDEVTLHEDAIQAALRYLKKGTAVQLSNRQ